MGRDVFLFLLMVVGRDVQKPEVEGKWDLEKAEGCY